MVVSMEKLFSEKELAMADFPRHHFVLVPLGDGQMNGLSSGDQWNGVLNALKSEIKDLRDRQEQGRDQQEKGITTLKSEIGELKKSQGMNVEELKRMEGSLREVEERVIQKMERSLREVEERVIQKMEERVGRMEESLLALLREMNKT
jgi:predicted  nucleic acid-binding Zn-ribbon protein